MCVCMCVCVCVGGGVGVGQRSETRFYVLNIKKENSVFSTFHLIFGHRFTISNTGYGELLYNGRSSYLNDRISNWKVKLQLRALKVNPALVLLFKFLTGFSRTIWLSFFGNSCHVLNFILCSLLFFTLFFRKFYRCNLLYTKRMNQRLKRILE